jgi:hypothetical protein
LRVSSSGRRGRITQADPKEDEMSKRSRAPLTPEQRNARRREQLDQLRQATSALLTTDGWQRWLRTRSRFHRYSLRNTLLIALQSRTQPTSRQRLGRPTCSAGGC